MKIAASRTALVNYITGLALDVTGVFDEPPRHDPFPFIQVGDFISTPDDLLVELGAQHVVEIHVYTREPQRDQVNALMDSLKSALHRAAFDVEGAQHVSTLVETVNVFEDPGELPKARQWHGTLRCRMILFDV